MRRAWLFICGFVIFFSLLTLLTGRGGVEHYTVEHIIGSARLPFAIFGWTPDPAADRRAADVRHQHAGARLQPGVA